VGFLLIGEKQVVQRNFVIRRSGKLKTLTYLYYIIIYWKIGLERILKIIIIISLYWKQELFILSW